MKKLITLLSIICVVGAGCAAALSEKLTPATLPQEAKDYVIKHGSDPNNWKGYQSLEKLNKLINAVNVTNGDVTFELQQLADQNEYDFGKASQSTAKSLKLAREREQALFGPTGILTLALASLGFGGAGVSVGKLFMSKPGDWKPEDVEDAMADLHVQLNDKEKQFTQTVLGLKGFFDKYKDGNKDEKIDTVIAEIKGFLSEAQDEETRKAVAVAKV